MIDFLKTLVILFLVCYAVFLVGVFSQSITNMKEDIKNIEKRIEGLENAKANRT